MILSGIFTSGCAGLAGATGLCGAIVFGRSGLSGALDVTGADTVETGVIEPA